jgi:DNA-binding NarL/FixJ family response regulator
VATPVVLFVDDDADVLAGLSLQLAAQPRSRHYRVLTAESGQQALDLLSRETVDIVVSDERMPGMAGSDLLTRVLEIAPDIVRIVLTGQATLDDAARAINGAEVFRYLQKPCSSSELLAVLEAGVARREAKRSPLTGFGLAELRLLSEREKEVLTLVTSGLRTGQVAQRLFVSPHTIRNHLKALFRKLGVNSQAALVARGQSSRRSA